MAYISQEEKKQIAPVVKAILKKNNLKGSLSINHRSTLVLTITEGPIDFISIANQANKERAERQGLDFYEVKGHYEINGYHMDSTFSGETLEMLEELDAALKGQGWFDKSDIMTDYFNVKHYVQIRVGRWDKSYKMTA